VFTSLALLPEWLVDKRLFVRLTVLYHRNKSIKRVVSYKPIELALLEFTLLPSVVLNARGRISYVCGPYLIVVVQVIGTDELCIWLIWCALR
jgi:hypothetical protein